MVREAGQVSHAFKHITEAAQCTRNTILIVDQTVNIEDRMGKRLKTEGLPNIERFFLDVDLWRPEDVRRARELLGEFRAVSQQSGCHIVDEIPTRSRKPFGNTLVSMQLDELARKFAALDRLSGHNFGHSGNTSANTLAVESPLSASND
jgi:hypothetical protein